MEQKNKMVILADQEREQLFKKIKTGTWAEGDEAVLIILEHLMNLDVCSNELKFWFDKESFFQEFGVTDQNGHSYSVERSVFPVITYRVNYKHNNEELLLSGRVRENFEKMFGPMNLVFKQFEYGFNRQNNQTGNPVEKNTKPKFGLWGTITKKIRENLSK